MGEKWAWPMTPWTASRWDKFLSAMCTSSESRFFKTFFKIIKIIVVFKN